MSQLSRLHCSLSTFKCQQLWSEICQGLVNSNFSLKVFFYCKIWSVVQHYYIMMCGYLWDFIWNMVYFRWHICTWSKKHSQMFSWANYLKQYFLSRSISPSSVCILFFWGIITMFSTRCERSYACIIPALSLNLVRKALNMSYEVGCLP